MHHVLSKICQYDQKHTLLSNFACFCAPKQCTCVHCQFAWSWKTTLIAWIFLRGWYPTSNTSGSPLVWNSLFFSDVEQVKGNISPQVICTMSVGKATVHTRLTDTDITMVSVFSSFIYFHWGSAVHTLFCRTKLIKGHWTCTTS